MQAIRIIATLLVLGFGVGYMSGQTVTLNGVPVDLSKNQVVVSVGTAPILPAPPPSATGTALSACGDITAAGNYYLTGDLSSAGTCFGIDADGIALNLNGHTITYDTAGTPNAPAIEGHDCWSTTNPPIDGPCGKSHGSLEVYGGKIVQAVSASSFSPVFEFGQGVFKVAPYIHDVTATFQNLGAQFYFSSYIPAGAKIENNTIYDNVTDIQHPGQGILSARSAFLGQAIKIHQNTNNPGTGDLISGNKIVGSPQGGVYSDNQYTMVTANDISMNATYSNDFCDAMAAEHQTFTKNNCHPVSGRGVHTNASYSVISDNSITVTELKQNPEYGGCEGGGTYGVQIEFDKSFLPLPPVGVQVTGNTIVASAGDCNAVGLRATSMTPAGSAAFSGNSVTTTNSGGAGHDFAISVDAEDGSGVSFTGNTFSSMYAFADGEWDGYRSNSIGHNTWLGTPQFSFVAIDGGCDPSSFSATAVCPPSFGFTDAVPGPVLCGGYSEATVTAGGKVTSCKAAH